VIDALDRDLGPHFFPDRPTARIRAPARPAARGELSSNDSGHDTAPSSACSRYPTAGFTSPARWSAATGNGLRRASMGNPGLSSRSTTRPRRSSACARGLTALYLSSGGRRGASSHIARLAGLARRHPGQPRPSSWRPRTSCSRLPRENRAPPGRQASRCASPGVLADFGPYSHATATEYASASPRPRTCMDGRAQSRGRTISSPSPRARAATPAPAKPLAPGRRAPRRRASRSEAASGGYGRFVKQRQRPYATPAARPQLTPRPRRVTREDAGAADRRASWRAWAAASRSRAPRPPKPPGGKRKGQGAGWRRTPP
jgi:hypothetical protein